MLSSTGLLARMPVDDATADPTGRMTKAGRRARHDVVVSAVHDTNRGSVGVVTSHGRILRLSVLDLPALPPTAGSPTLQGGVPLRDVLALAGGERPLALTSLSPDSPGMAIGTAAGIVKRVAPEHPANRDAWEIITLRDGDEVVGAVELTNAGPAGDDLAYVIYTVGLDGPPQGRRDHASIARQPPPVDGEAARPRPGRGHGGDYDARLRPLRPRSVPAARMRRDDGARAHGGCGGRRPPR